MNEPSHIHDEIFDQMPLQVWKLRKDHCYAYANNIHLEFFGKHHYEILNKNIISNFGQEEGLIQKISNEQVWKTGNGLSEDVWLSNSKGERRLLRVKKFPEKDKMGVMTCLICIAEDISDLNNQLPVYEQNKLLYQSLVNNSKDAIIILFPPKWEFVSYNPAFKAMFKVEGTIDFKCLTPWMISPMYQPDGSLSSEKALENINKALKDNWATFEWIHRRFNGETFPCRITLIKVIIGKAELIQSIIEDISEQKKAEAALKKNTDVLANLSQHIPNGYIFQLSTLLSENQWKLIFAGQGIEPLHELSLSQITEDPTLIIQQIDESELQKFREVEFQAKQNPINFNTEIKYHTPSGKTRWSLVNAALHKSKDGFVLWDGIVMDITDRKKTEDALRDSEAKLKLSLKVSNASIFENDFDNGKVESSPELYQHLGYTENEIPKSVNEMEKLIHPDDRQAVLHALEKHQKGILPYYYAEFRMRDKSCNWRWVEGRGQFIKSNDKGDPVVLIGISKDITDRKLAEESLVESEQKYRLIFNHAPVGIFQLNAKGIIKAFNNLFLEITGFNKNQISGIDFLKLTNSEIASKTLEALRGSYTSYEGPLDMASNNLTIPVRLLMSPIIGRKSRVEGVIGLIEDRSHQKEKEELQTKVAIAEESVKFKQNFLANMSHEIRTPLTGILGMADILDKTPLLPQQKEYLGILKNTSENLMEIINQVLDFSKIEAGKLSLKLESFSFSTIIQLSEKYFNSICTKSISFHSYIDKHIPDLMIADKNRIIQVINNMIGNSVKFTERGSITIEAWPGSENEIQTGNQLFDDPGKLYAIKILVSDTGMGITKEKQKELFLPFSQIEQNDARRFEGTGLGLSICKQLVEMHGGKIGVISQPGKGSTFWFTFVCKKDYEEKQNQSNSGAIEDKEIHPLRILLAEDKKVNQQVIKLMLINMGHTVEIAENGLKVLEMYQPGCFDLILMDIQMPLMDGIAATQELRARFSGLPPIIGLSANAFEGDREKYIARGMDDYLTKPVKTEDFVNLINRLCTQQT